MTDDVGPRNNPEMHSKVSGLARLISSSKILVVDEFQRASLCDYGKLTSRRTAMLSPKDPQ